MAGQPAAEPRPDLAERQVDLVVHDEHAVEVELEARRAPGRRCVPDSFMYVSGCSTATRGPPGAGAALAQQPAELLLRLRQIPARAPARR